jgi:hypothetical protein
MIPTKIKPMKYLILLSFCTIISALQYHPYYNWQKLINSSTFFNQNYVLENKKYFQIIIKSANISKECVSSIWDTITALNTSENWSFKMFNSWGRFPPSGILEGTVTDFGDYDQCLAIKPNQVIGESLYCLIDISLPLPKPMPIHQNFFHKVNVLPEFVNKSQNNIFVEFSEDASYFYWISLKLGICAPNKCSQNDIHILAEKSLYWFLFILLNIIN